MMNYIEQVKRNQELQKTVNWNAAIVQKVLGLSYVPEASQEGLVRDLMVFQKAQGLTADGILGPKTWERIVELTMTPKDRAIKKIVDRVIIFESRGRYDALNLDGEFRGLFKGHSAEGKVHIGLSAGLIQFTQDGGSLGKLFKLMAQTDECLFKSIVGESWDELLSVTNAAGESGFRRFGKMSDAEKNNPKNFPLRGPRVKPVKLGDKRYDLWEPEWRPVIRALLNHEKFKPCQWQLALELYLDPMKPFLQKHKLTSEKSVVVAFNLSVHRGASGAQNFMDNYFGKGRTERQILEAIAKDDNRVDKLVNDASFTYNQWEGW